MTQRFCNAKLFSLFPIPGKSPDFQPTEEQAEAAEFRRKSRPEQEQGREEFRGCLLRPSDAR